MKKNKEKETKKKKQKKPINWTKLFTKATIWFMLIVMIAFFISCIVWGIN